MRNSYNVNFLTRSDTTYLSVMYRYIQKPQILLGWRYDREGDTSLFFLVFLFIRANLSFYVLIIS